jgi:hypothetical protein
MYARLNMHLLMFNSHFLIIEVSSIDAASYSKFLMALTLRQIVKSPFVHCSWFKISLNLHV